MSITDHTNIRNKQLGLKVKEEFYWKVKKLALQKRCCIVEIIEQSVELLSKIERERESNKLEKRII